MAEQREQKFYSIQAGGTTKLNYAERLLKRVKGAGFENASLTTTTVNEQVYNCVQFAPEMKTRSEANSLLASARSKGFTDAHIVIRTE